MEALLPSEIARLVFGYLEDQKCDEAARSFLDASPHLHECRTAVSNGRRFNTRVNGHTLVDIFDKFFAAHSLVQERLSKVADCEQVRQCGDLLEQLRFLIGGSRGQRFVVNINVPSQANSQTYGGSPLISSSVRKRHYSSGSDRDRTKRTHKTIHQLFEKQSEPVTSQLGSETVEATPLESLPGHTNLNARHQHESTATQDSDGLYCTSTKNDFVVDCTPLGDATSLPKQICPHSRLSQQRMEQDNSSGRSERYSPDPVIIKKTTDEARHVEDEECKNSMLRGKTTATSTDELTTYSSIEVQTTPYALSEAESNELEDEPIENLSLLTKELLNRTELQERIAENINKAILPMEMPSKDESICESVGGELNTSIMAELNNAIKSIVAATETDPIFEHFLDEIIGPNMDTDTSPDEDPDSKGVTKVPTDSRISEKSSNTDVIDMELEKETAVLPGKSLNSNGTIEVPLKQRLRSSSRQHNNKLEEEGDRPKEVDKTDNSLEDHNAAAILSIINANIISDKQTMDRSGTVGNSMAMKPAAVEQPTELSQITSAPSERQVADSTGLVENDRTDNRSEEKPVAKKLTSAKSDPEPKVDHHDVITEQEIMAMPTLIVCSQEEMNECIGMNNYYSTGTTAPCPEARFVPIAPKGPEKSEPVQPLYLRAVQVPVQVSNRIQPSVVGNVEKVKTKSASPLKMLRGNRKRNRKVTRKGKNLKPAVVSTSVVNITESLSVGNEQQQPVQTGLESITLYANDNSFGTMIETGHMPNINLDDSMTLTGAGLSPYLKFHDSKNPSRQPEMLHCENLDNQMHVESLDTDAGGKADESLVLPHTENILITRRTPKSLLKSRSKNNRLSMSTPRRRSSHIRALDFNTPIKSSSSEQKFGANKSAQFSPKSSKRVRSVCRTSLFKSPPFSNSINNSQRLRTPVKDRQLCKIPIATRSPAPKLMGGWEKYTGVGMILGGTSPHPSSTSSVFEPEEMPRSPIKPSSSSLGGVKKSWDADLRQALQESQQHPACSTTVTKKGSAKVKGRTGKSCNAANGADKISKAESGENSNEVERVDTTERQDPKKITKRDAGYPGETDSVPEEKNSDRQVAGLLKQVNKSGESEKGNGVENSKGDGEEKARPTPMVVDGSKPKEKPVVKKYAKLKTLETKISKYKEKNLLDSTVPICSVDSSQKKCEYLKISPESQSQPVHLPRIIDLETPRKADSSTGIPATPRVLSPSSSTITPFTKLTEELSKVPSFVNTPDFPPTPSIALTPKVLGENTIDAIKKREFGTCSPYYEPSNEQPDIMDKLIGGLNTSKENPAEILLVAAPLANVDSCTVVDTSGGIASDFAMSSSTSKLEITQFEVIKENLPKKETDKELKISGSSKNADEILPRLQNSACDDTAELSKAVNLNIRRPPSNDEDSSSASGNESSDSSSSDTSSSSSCSSSCSCSSIATTSTPFKSATKCKKQSNVQKESSNDCSVKRIPGLTNSQNLLSEISPIIAGDGFTTLENNPVPRVSSFTRGETSPLKMMPLIKTEEEVQASLKETPAKDEALLSEANISETPSSSKSGIECLTNLNSKISALDSLGEQSTSRQNHLTNKVHVPSQTRLKPKVISVQHLLPDVSVALKPSLLTDVVSSTTQPLTSLTTLSSATSDGKLGSHLEKKRLRLMAKLKTNSQPKLMAQKKTAKLSVKNNCKDRNEVIQSQDWKNCTSQAATHNPASKKSAQAAEKKDFLVKNTNLKAKQKANNLNDGKAKITQARTTLTKLYSKEKNVGKYNMVQIMVEKSVDVIRRKSSTLVKRSNGAALKGEKITKIEDLEAVRKKEVPDRCASGTSDPGTEKPNLNDCVTEPPTKSTEITEDLKDLKVTESVADSVNTTKLIDPIQRRNPDEQDNRDEGCGSASSSVPIPAKKNSVAVMSKVDQIKRDLFSDEENNDQRTTRSRTRQLSDAQKIEPATVAAVVPVSQIEEKVSESATKKPKEELANVLECLKLVPANKNETIVDKPSDVPKDYVNDWGEYVCFFDDTAPAKKKKKEKKKIVISELAYGIAVEPDEDDIEEYLRIMAFTDYEELFNLSPKPKKRTVAKKVGVKSSKSMKAEASKPTDNTESILKNELTKPLTTSTGAVKLKTVISKAGKITGKVHPEKSVKQTDKDEKKKPEECNQISQKRKATEPEDQPLDQLVEKKRRIADPQTLLKKLDLDLFLTSVHGPV